VNKVSGREIGEAHVTIFGAPESRSFILVLQYGGRLLLIDIDLWSFSRTVCPSFCDKNRAWLAIAFPVIAFSISERQRVAFCLHLVIADPV